jgi:hypothetical protein
MIKHRFILRSWKEAEVFAAVPTEHEVLIWQEWERPIAVATLLEAIDKHAEDVKPLTRRITVEMLEQAIANVNSLPANRREEVNATIPYMLKLREQMLKGGDPEVSGYDPAVRSMTAYLAAIQTIRSQLESIKDVTPETLRQTIKALEIERYGALLRAREILKNQAPIGKEFVMEEILRDDLWRNAVAVPDPTDILSCPEGLPFSYYTIEIPHPPAVKAVDSVDGSPIKNHRFVINVIEGKASFEPQFATELARERIIGWYEETMKLAAELVTQMLTERQRNPTAPTRLQVDEVNSAKAREAREAEERDAKEPNPEPRMRSIKFDVSPPRYLREAAERIIASKVRAHWVMGHWRNQPYGEAHRLRRQTWIAPHVRGLGEAGATMSKVAAPHASPMKNKEESP